MDVVQGCCNDMQLAVVTEAHGECRHHVLWACVVHQMPINSRRLSLRSVDGMWTSHILIALSFMCDDVGYGQASSPSQREVHEII
jgi:hypothetical protein